MSLEGPLVPLSLTLGVLMVLSSLAVVRMKDLVYASIFLAVLGSLNAALIALLGFTIVAVFIIIVYVGAAVMFIIVSIAMLGGGGEEARDEFRGLLAASGFVMGVLASLASLGIVHAYTKPNPINLSDVSKIILSKYTPVLGVLFVALAATLIEAISLSRRGE